jgi:hypothetical protein
MDDIDDVALSYAEVKALAAGSPLIKERMDLDVEISRLKVLKSAHNSQQYRLEGRLRQQLPKEIHALQERIRGLQKDIALRDAETPAGVEDNPELFQMEIMGQTFQKREDAGKAILLSLQLVSPESNHHVRIGHYRGFELSASFDAFDKTYQVFIKGSMVYSTVLDKAPLGNVQRIDNALERMEKTLQQNRDELAAMEQQVISAKGELGKLFPQEQELKDKLTRLAELDGMLRMDENVLVNLGVSEIIELPEDRNKQHSKETLR